MHNCDSFLFFSGQYCDKTHDTAEAEPGKQDRLPPGEGSQQPRNAGKTVKDPGNDGTENGHAKIHEDGEETAAKEKNPQKTVSQFPDFPDRSLFCHS